MTQEWTVPAWAVAVVVVVLVTTALLVAVALVRLRRVSARVESLLATTPAPAAATDHSAETLPAPPASYVITRLGDAPVDPEPLPAPVPVVPPGVFAEAVVRESSLRAAALLHGVRRAMAPQVRARIRAEMRSEVKRARKVRRAEQRVALREWQARQRAEEAA